MIKQHLVATIIARLEADLALFTAAALHAHAAATHEECQPDNKYDTTALEASYVAQGQANRAQEIRQSLEAYRSLELQEFDAGAPVRLSALVTLEDETGRTRRLFIGPQAGGMKLADPAGEIVVITPASPLGNRLLGLAAGDEVQGVDAGKGKLYTIVAVT
ncbi:GreA/GreB family elongation factor [Geobacter sulfurreducens subsp. ethanolicus]|uniref:transcription elongation factor GreAB n=1 Tax=Geobacter sulfurreducens TaxID=35554 RepID=UPI0025729A19|nr:transcription elongation factor GreAB [Geobacter sulfurreducens]BEH08528.1 GreA/GreB family elongation factor [Geobacter sulfurreducens subsp. ethanolicus]